MNGDDGVPAIVLAAEHLLDLAGLDLLIERVEGGPELRIDRFAGIGPLDEHGEVVALPAQRHHQVAVLLEAPAALQDLLRFSLVFPEVGGSGARLEAGQLFLWTGCLKDNSGDRRRAW